MQEEQIPYYTYYDEFKDFISVQECIHKIYKIFSKYKKITVLAFITNFINETGFDNNFNNIKRVHLKYFGRDDKYLIHRRSIHVLAQSFFSFDNFHLNDNSEIVNIVDVCMLFLLANQILNISEGLDYSSDLRVLFNSYKFSNDLIVDNDVRSHFYFYPKFYKSLVESPHYNEFNKIIKKRLNVGIKKYSQILENQFLNVTPISKKFFRKYFSIQLHLTFKKWQERKPIVNIPYEYRMLQTYPFIFINGPYFKKFPWIPFIYRRTEYCVCSPHFLMNSVAKKIYNILRSNKLFGGEFGIAAEKEIVNYFKNSLTNENCIRVNLRRDEENYEYADFGILKGNIVFLFEIKTGSLPMLKKYEENYDKFKKNFDNTFVNKSGVRQQIERIRDISDNFEMFCATTGLNPDKKYQIVPVLIFLDDEFNASGLNRYLGNEFKRILREYNFKRKNIFISDNNISLTLNELKLSVDKLNSPEKILSSIFKYFQNFHTRAVSLLNYENYLLKEYLKN